MRIVIIRYLWIGLFWSKEQQIPFQVGSSVEKFANII